MFQCKIGLYSFFDQGLKTFSRPFLIVTYVVIWCKNPQNLLYTSSSAVPLADAMRYDLHYLSKVWGVCFAEMVDQNTGRADKYSMVGLSFPF